MPTDNTFKVTVFGDAPDPTRKPTKRELLERIRALEARIAALEARQYQYYPVPSAPGWWQYPTVTCSSAS